MSELTPQGGRALHQNDNGVVSGHPATMAKLVADGMVVPHQGDGGTHWMTEQGWAALEEWRQRHAGRPARRADPVEAPRGAARSGRDGRRAARPARARPGRP
jgi:hypothetical protein